MCMCVCWIDSYHSYIDMQRAVEAPSPITLAKAIKNEQELEGMRQVKTP